MPRELPDDDFPFVLNTGRLQHQWHTMTKTGKVDKLNKLDSGPFVEIHPARRRRARHRRRPTGRADVAAGQGGAARSRHRPGAAGQLLRAVPLERRTRRVPHDQRADQRRRRPRLAAARVQGVRGEPAAGEVGGPRRRRTELRPAASRLSPTTKRSTSQPFSLGSPRVSAVSPRCPRQRPCATGVRLWIDGLLAGRYSRIDGGSPPNSQPRTGRWCCGRRRPATPRSSRHGWRDSSAAPSWSIWTMCSWRSWPRPATCW